jgi:putative FmdB family regulatory protein
MPLYDFRCRSCGHAFEALVRKDPPQCPSCHGVDLERQLSTFAVSSRERTQAAAAKKTKKAAAVARVENAILDKEYDLHERDET